MTDPYFSELGVEFLKGEEGSVKEGDLHVSYVDSVGVRTIGYGHTGPDVTSGQKISEDRAIELMRADVKEAETAVRNSVKAELLPNQFDALVSFTYNVGVGGFKNSTLLAKLNAGHFEDVPSQFGRWVKGTVDGVKVTLPGLVNRRNAEIELWNDDGAGRTELTRRAVQGHDYSEAARQAMKIDQTPGEFGLTDVYQDSILRSVANASSTQDAKWAVSQMEAKGEYVDPIIRIVAAPNSNSNSNNNSNNSSKDSPTHITVQTPKGVQVVKVKPHAGDYGKPPMVEKTVQTPSGPKKVVVDNSGNEGRRPIVLDLEGDGIEITALGQSAQHIIGADGLLHRTAWAGAGDGVLFVDADGDGTISNLAEYVFTEWDRTASDDMEALGRVFDTDGDGKLTEADARWGEFRVMVTNADGTITAKTLAELGITEINLRPDVTRITLPDGSQITGQTTFTMNGEEQTAANTTLVSEAQGYRVVEVVQVAGGKTTTSQTAYDAAGEVAYIITREVSDGGNLAKVKFDVNGDGVVDQFQITELSLSAGNRVELVSNYRGADSASSELLNRTETTRSSDGSMVVIKTDTQGAEAYAVSPTGFWYDRIETQQKNADGSRSLTIEVIARDGTVLLRTSDTIDVSGTERVSAKDYDADGLVDLVVTETVGAMAGGGRVEGHQTAGRNGSLLTSVTETIDGNQHTTLINSDGDGRWETKVVETTSVGVVGADTITQTDAQTRNFDGTLRTSSISTVSADGLRETMFVDLDGDGDIDRTSSKTTEISVSGDRTVSTLVQNGDGTIANLSVETLGKDKVSSTTYIDLDRDGNAAEAQELVRSVTVEKDADAKIETVTAQTWNRTADGSITSHVVDTSTNDGRTRVTQQDADGDGIFDLTRTETNVTLASGGSQTTITERRGESGAGTDSLDDLTTRSFVERDVSGLSITTSLDIGGDKAFEKILYSNTNVSVGGVITRTEETKSGDGAVTLNKSVTVISADRLQTTVTADANGDGITDEFVQSKKALDGSNVAIRETYSKNGALISREETSVSADGMTRIQELDKNGDRVVDEMKLEEVSFDASGNKITTKISFGGDGSIRQRVEEIETGNGLGREIKTDIDGDNVWDKIVTIGSSIDEHGQTVTVTTNLSDDGEVISSSTNLIGRNGLSRVKLLDVNGDSKNDRWETSEDTLNADGSKITITKTGVGNTPNETEFLTKSELFVSSNGRTVTQLEDLDGDGDLDRSTQTVVGDDGTKTITKEEYGLEDPKISDGKIASEITSISANGMITTIYRDIDGDKEIDNGERKTTTLSSNGSTATATQQLSRDGSILGEKLVETSHDGWTEPPRVYRRVICSVIKRPYQVCLGLHRTPPLLLRAGCIRWCQEGGGCYTNRPISRFPIRLRASFSTGPSG